MQDEILMPNVCRCSYPTKEAKYLQIPFPLKWTPVFLDFLSRFLLKAAKYLLPLIFLKAAKHLQRATKAAKNEKTVGWVFDDGITDQAANSKLSKQAYIEDDISSMFVQLYEDGILSLLFLKSVLSVEMYVWDVGMPEPRKTYSCSINSANDDVVWHRQALQRFSKLKYVSDCEMDAFSLDFLSEAVVGGLSQNRTHKFYVVQTMASPSSRIGSFAAMAAKDYDMHLLPWASVAACVSDDSLNDDHLKLGRAFCFLPLPVKTGFRVHINGYFEVSSNRRGIWYGDDMDRSGKVRSIWNRLLLEDVVAPSFAKLLLGMPQFLGSTKTYYSL
ncbi:UNVERIFIED_CONTAM: Sacsin [Sesamum calycinum]|uniref:Sacsin n=1 Tax=Sesamum calycinum TaxID=2727403 RepID=A0AAW2J325_9LAMI